MRTRILLNLTVFAVAATFASCGTYTPNKDPFTSDAPNENFVSRQAEYETGIVRHVVCEIGEGLVAAQQLELPWIEQWGTTVTQSITVEDQSGLSPGITTIDPMRNVVFSFPSGGNVTSPQSFSLSVGGTASANALRTETIQYTFRNRDILEYRDRSCRDKIRGVMIDGDLKIREFIFDKASIAASGTPSLQGVGPLAWKLPPFNTFTEEITFVAAYGGSVTPTWKLARLTANTSSNLIVSERTNTNDLVITLGPLKYPQPRTGPIILVDTAMSQHQARVQASAIAVSVSGQSH